MEDQQLYLFTYFWLRWVLYCGSRLFTCMVASLVEEHRLRAHGLVVVNVQAQVRHFTQLTFADKCDTRTSCCEACEVLLDQDQTGIHWQADS